MNLTKLYIRAKALLTGNVLLVPDGVTTSSDLKIFQQFIRKERLSAAVFKALLNADLKTLFPHDVFQEFKKSYLDQCFKNEKVLFQMDRLRQVFVEAGIDLIFLKGLMSSYLYWGDIDSRSIVDIDILVRPGEWARAEKVLLDAGYQRTSKILVNRTFMETFTHHAEYVGPAPLDLHWHLTCDGGYRVNYDRVWQNKEQVALRGQAYDVLSNGDQVLFQILSIFQDMKLGYLKHRSFIDLYMMLRVVYKLINWSDFFRQRQEEGNFFIVLNVLDWLLEVMDARQEFAVLDLMISENKNLLALKNKEDFWDIFNLSRYAWKNKMLAVQVARSNVLSSAAWWAVSLPFRLYMHPRTRRQYS